MSEQTPETHSDMAAGMGDGEPSMEDILASIRKIIADDSVTAMESPEDEVEEFIPDFTPVLADATLATDDIDPIDASGEIDLAQFDLTNDLADALTGEDGDVVDLEIPDLEDELTEIGAQLAPIEELMPLSLTDDMRLTEGSVVEGDIETDDALDLKSGMAALLEDVGLESTGLAQEAEPDMDDEIDLDALMANFGTVLLEDDLVTADLADTDLTDTDLTRDDLDALDLSEEFELLEVEDEGVALNFDNVKDMSVADSNEDPDLLLLKSLMADLTDKEAHDDEEALAGQDATIALEIPEPEPEPELDAAAETNILDDILGLNIDDELATPADYTSPETLEAVAEIEQDNMLETDLIEADLEMPQEPETSPRETPLSLSDIAAAAEADANNVPSLTAVTGAAIAAGATVIAASKAEDEDIELDDLEIPEPELVETDHPEITEMETADMARAAKNEIIMDEVTEIATADAFASLNQVVEEKAIKAERGDRIGDLVMAALQPMLKEWLDANLKTIVERAVTKEVKRISTGK